jgi:hypothetical protein
VLVPSLAYRMEGAHGMSGLHRAPSASRPLPRLVGLHGPRPGAPAAAHQPWQQQQGQGEGHHGNDHGGQQQPSDGGADRDALPPAKRQHSEPMMMQQQL